jgi:NADH:ubiquinone reductase (H+-translocating)
MSAAEPGEVPPGPVVVLGAGYAGLATAQGIARRSRGKLPVVLVDRHPVHVLRTELYDIGRLARAAGDPGPWTVPLARALERSSVEFRTGEVRTIDLDGRALELDSGRLSYGQLVIGLGSVAAYYGVPGAAENTHQVYRLSGAQRLAAAIREVEQRSRTLPAERRPRIVIVGGGSTATELAAEIAATDWAAIAGPGARAPEVLMITGALPFLAGFPPGVVSRARRVLRRRGVALIEGLNVTRVDPGKVAIADGSTLAFDLAVWCAGLEAPPVVRSLPVPHGRAGRVRVDPTLEIPERPGIFAVGDVIELADPETGAPVPGTAAAAIAGGEVAAANAVARWKGLPLVPFRYRERGVVVALGTGSAAGSVRHVTVWGSPAALLKRLVQRDYAVSVERGEPPHLA